MKELILEKLSTLSIINEFKLLAYIDFCLTNNIGHNIVGATELHHILPKAKSLFPEFKDLKTNNWNGSYLTYENHYIAHSLLAEACNDRSILYAWHRTKISNDSNDLILSAKRYRELKERHLHVVKQTSSNANKNKVDVKFNGKVIKIDKTDERYISGELVSHHKGKKLSEDVKKKISNALNGRKNGPCSNETKEKLSKIHAGRNISDEWRKNISDAKIGKKLGPAQIYACPHCKKEGKSNAMKRWHFENCKMNKKDIK